MSETTTDPGYEAWKAAYDARRDEALTATRWQEHCDRFGLPTIDAERFALFQEANGMITVYSKHWAGPLTAEDEAAIDAVIGDMVCIADGEYFPTALYAPRQK